MGAVIVIDGRARISKIPEVPMMPESAVELTLML
jgi:hypothetical protein